MERAFKGNELTVHCHDDQTRSLLFIRTISLTINSLVFEARENVKKHRIYELEAKDRPSARDLTFILKVAPDHLMSNEALVLETLSESTKPKPNLYHTAFTGTIANYQAIAFDVPPRYDLVPMSAFLDAEFAVFEGYDRYWPLIVTSICRGMLDGINQLRLENHLCTDLKPANMLCHIRQLRECKLRECTFDDGGYRMVADTRIIDHDSSFDITDFLEGESIEDDDDRNEEFIFFGHALTTPCWKPPEYERTKWNGVLRLTTFCGGFRSSIFQWGLMGMHFMFRERRDDVETRKELWEKLNRVCRQGSHPLSYMAHLLRWAQRKDYGKRPSFADAFKHECWAQDVESLCALSTDDVCSICCFCCFCASLCVDIQCRCH